MIRGLGFFGLGLMIPIGFLPQNTTAFSGGMTWNRILTLGEGGPPSALGGSAAGAGGAAGAGACAGAAPPAARPIPTMAAAAASVAPQRLAALAVMASPPARRLRS